MEQKAITRNYGQPPPFVQFCIQGHNDELVGQNSSTGPFV
jgi:hypothetical protein